MASIQNPQKRSLPPWKAWPEAGTGIQHPLCGAENARSVASAVAKEDLLWAAQGLALAGPFVLEQPLFKNGSLHAN